MNCARQATWVAALALAGVLASCDEAPPDEVERVRAIKPYYVVEPAGGDLRRYSGSVTAANTSALSFAVSGTVQTVEVTKGERVLEGQVLATLDTKPFQLDVSAARSEVAAVKAEADQASLELERKRQLFDRGWVAKAALDQAVAAFEATKSQLNLARSRLGLAERDLANAGLLAPFDGVIALRDIDPFVEIKKGEAIFQIDSEGSLEIDLSIPDSVIGRLSIGTPVTIDAGALEGCGCNGRITEIGSSADTANAVAVTAAILEAPSGLLPGMAVEASLFLSDDGGSGGFLVPLVAIAPGDDNARGYVFKYDSASGQVRKTAIQSEGNISENLIGVTQGVTAGDIVAAAGVSFLRDGQAVRLMGE